MNHPHDLSDNAVELWRMRYAAERDTLGAIACDPAALWPTLMACGVSLDTFDGELHRAVYVVLQEAGHAGRDACEQIVRKFCDESGYYPEQGVSIFHAAPPSIGYAEYQAKRLLLLAKAIRTAREHLTTARTIVARTVATLASEGMAA